MAILNGDELPLIAPFSTFGVDFVDGRSLTTQERDDALVEFRVLYAAHVAGTSANMAPNRECAVDECSVSDVHIQAWLDAQAIDPSVPTLMAWLRAGGIKGFRNVNLGLAHFTLWGFGPGNQGLKGYVHADNVRIEREEIIENRVTISARVFTVWEATQQQSVVKRDSLMQRYLLENVLQTPPARRNIDIVEIRHYRGAGIGLDSVRHPAYDVEFWPEFTLIADEIKEPEDAQVEALRRKDAGPRPPDDPEVDP